MNSNVLPSLPKVSKVEIIILAGDRELLDKNPQASVTARCHIPPFGLRFFTNNQLVCQASVCWECNNIYGHANSNRFSYAFDANASISQELLMKLENITKRRTTS
jgi:hypothetical protein